MDHNSNPLRSRAPAAQVYVPAPCPTLCSHSELLLRLSAHLAAANQAPDELQGSPQALAVWVQELYSRAYALQVVARWAEKYGTVRNCTEAHGVQAGTGCGALWVLGHGAVHVAAGITRPYPHISMPIAFFHVSWLAAT